MAFIFVLISCLTLGQSEYLEQVLDSTMTLGWSIDKENDEISITLKCKITKGYCSIGFRESMKDCDMVAALTDSNDVRIEDYWSYNHDTPPTDVAEGGTKDLTLLEGGIDENGYIDVTFKRKLDTKDEYDQAIEADIKADICWAYLNNRNGWYEHSHDSHATFTWATTESTKYFSKSEASLTRLMTLLLIFSSFS